MSLIRLIRLREGIKGPSEHGKNYNLCNVGQLEKQSALGLPLGLQMITEEQ